MVVLSSIIVYADNSTLARGEFYNLVKEGNIFSFKVSDSLNRYNGTEYVPINTSPITLDSSHEYYQYGYRGVVNAKYDMYFKPDIQSNYPIAFVYDGYVIRMEPESIGYVDPSNGFQKAILDTVRSSSVQMNNNRITYPEAFYGVDLQFTFENKRLKEDMICNSDCVTAIQNNLPSSFGLSNTQSYLVWRTKLQFIGLDVENGKEIKTSQNFTTQDKTFFKNALGELKFLFPVVNATDALGNSVNITNRLEFEPDGNAYLYSGVKLSEMNGWTAPIYFDPTTSIVLNETLNLSLPHELLPLELLLITNYTDNGVNELNISTNLSGGYNQIVPQYAIDPSGLQFGTMIVRVNESRGNVLFKCESWNMSSLDCGGEEWLEIKNVTLISGQSYTFTINSTDPGFSEYAQSLTESSSSTGVWTNKLEKTFTVTSTNNPNYMLSVVSAIGSSSTNRPVEARISLNGVQIGYSYIEPKDVLNREFFGGVFNISLEPGVHNISLQFKSDGVATAFMRDAFITVLEMNTFDSKSSVDNTTYILSTTQQDLLTLNYTPVVTDNYLIFGRASVFSKSVSQRTTLRLDDSVINSVNMRMGDTLDAKSILFHNIVSLNTSMHKFAIRSYATGAGNPTVSNQQLRLFRLTGDYYYKTNVTTYLHNTSSVSYVNSTVLSFTPNKTGSHMVIATGEYSSDTTNRRGLARLMVDGVEQCEQIYEPTSIGSFTIDQGMAPFGCIINSTFTNTTHIANIEFATSSSIAHMRNSRITVINIDELIPTVSLIGPSNFSYTDSIHEPTIGFSCSAYNSPIYNMSLLLTNENGENLDINQTINFNGTMDVVHNFTVNTIDEGEFFWNCLAYDGYGNAIRAPTNYTFLSNFTDVNGGPIINLTSPVGDTLLDSYVNFHWNVSDTLYDYLSCDLFIDNVLNVSSSPSNVNISTNYTVTNLNEGNHSWRVECEDNHGSSYPYGNLSQRGFSINQTFVIDIPYGNLTSSISLPSSGKVGSWVTAIGNVSCSGDTCAIINGTISAPEFDINDCELRPTTPFQEVELGILYSGESIIYEWDFRCSFPNIVNITTGFKMSKGGQSSSNSSSLITILYGKELFENIFTGHWYEPGETAIIGISVEDDGGVAIEQFNLSANIYYPNGTLWVSDLVLTELVTGIYKSQINIPTNAPLGDYIYTITNSFFIGNVFQVKNITQVLLASQNVNFQGIEDILTQMNLTLNSVQDYVIDINSTVYDIELFLNQTLFNEVDQVEELLAQVLQNNSVMFDTLLDIQSNVTQTSNNVNQVYEFLVQFNNTSELNFQNVFNEINANEAKLDIINSTVNTILNEIQNTIEPSLNGITANISSMQFNLELIINHTDTLESGQALILQNLSYLVLQLYDLRADMLLINSSLSTDISDSKTVILENITNSTSSILSSILNSQTIITTQLSSINESLFNKLMLESGLIQNEIQLVNGTLVVRLDSLNSSITTRFNTIDTTLTNLTGELLNVQLRLDCAFTINEVCDRLNSLLFETGLLNTTLQTMNQYLLVNITDYLSDLNATLQGIKADTTYIRDRSDLIYNNTVDILAKWGTLNASSLYLSFTEINGSVQNIQDWLYAFNVTEQSRHNTTQELVLNLTNDVQILNGTVTTILEETQNVSDRLTDINSTIQTIQTNVNTLQTTVVAVNTTLYNNQQVINASTQLRFDIIEQNTNYIQESVNNLTASLLLINSSLSGGISNLDTSISVVQQSINNLTGDLSAINSTIEQTLTVVNGLTTDISQLGTDVFIMNQTITTISTDVIQLGTDIALVNNTLNSVYNNTQDLLLDVNTLNLDLLRTETELLAMNLSLENSINSLNVSSTNNLQNISDKLDSVTFQLLTIDQHLLGLIANISEIKELTQILNGTIQYEITDVHHVVGTETYKTQLVLTDLSGRLIELDTTPTVILIDPLNNTIVSSIPMDNVTNGVWDFEYITSSGSNVGNWITEVTAVYNNETFYLYDEWTLLANPTKVEVEVIRVCPKDVIAEITIQNEGITPYEYQYFWWTTDNAFEDFGGPTVHDMGRSAKLLQPGETFIVRKTLSNIVSPQQNHYLKAKTFYGEYSFALDTYTDEYFNCPSITQITGQAISDDKIIQTGKIYGLTALSYFLIFLGILFIIFLLCRRKRNEEGGN